MRTNRVCAVLFPLCVLAATLGCAPFNVQVDYDPKVSFGALHSYDWARRATSLTSAPRDPRIDNDLVDGRVRRAVDAALVAKGYVMAPAGGSPDFRVGYYIAIESKLDVQTIPAAYGYGVGSWGSPVYAQQLVDQYEQGTLFIDVIDGKTNTMVWRGHASARIVPDLSPEERERRLNDAVQAILVKFPPPVK